MLLYLKIILSVCISLQMGDSVLGVVVCSGPFFRAFHTQLGPALFDVGELSLGALRLWWMA